MYSINVPGLASFTEQCIIYTKALPQKFKFLKTFAVNNFNSRYVLHMHKAGGRELEGRIKKEERSYIKTGEADT